MNAQPLDPTHAPSPAPADARDFFDGSGHLRVLRHLQQAIAQDDRLVVLTGDEGVGKTTVVQRLLRGFDRSAIWCVLLSATHLVTGELPGSLAQAFGAPAAASSAADLHGALRRHLASHADGRTVLAVIDDAQGLAPEAIAELDELAREGPLRVLLVGRPALRMVLQQQLPLQPASLSCHLEPLLDSETPAYMAQRLRRVGWKGTPEFSAEAQALIHRFSRGVPLRIDRLCDRLLRSARRRSERTIAADAVRRIARPRLDADSIPMLTSAIDEPPSSGWAATSSVPPDSELPQWARVAAEPAAADDTGAAVRRRRIALGWSAAVVASVIAVWAWRSVEAPRVDDSMATTAPAPVIETPPAPAPPLQAPPPAAAAPPAPQPAKDVAPVEPPRPAAAPPRTAANDRPPKRAGTPLVQPSPVPGPCTATVAALGLCASAESSP